MEKKSGRKALFLDRDGVINVDCGYTHKWSEKIIIKESIELVKRFNAKGFLVFIITNQSGIGRGYYTIHKFYEFMEKLINYFKINDAIIHDYFFCVCNPQVNNCINRKPNPGMIFKAKDRYDLCIQDCLLVGDQISDIQAGFNAGISKLFLYQKYSKNDLYFPINCRIKRVNTLSFIDYEK